MVRILGWVVSAASALALLFAGYAIPLWHFGTMAAGPTDPRALVGSFNNSLAMVIVVLSVVYAGGLLMARRSGAWGAPGDVAGVDSAPGLPAAIVAVLLLGVAGAALAVFAGLLGEAPAAVLLVPLVWWAALVLFAATSLWGTVPRDAGVTLVCAGLLLTGFVMFFAGTIVEPERLALVERFLREVAQDRAGSGSLGFISRVVSTLPLAATAMIAVGLPLLILPARRIVHAPRWALAAGVVLVCASAAIPRLMAAAALLSPAEAPAPAPLVDFSAVPPPPAPPPPPPDR
jgi:hypothetical protein